MRRMPAILALTLLLGLTGCLDQPAPSDRFYPLAIDDPGRRYGQPLLDGTVEVARLSASGLTGERAIVYRQDGGPALQQYAYHYWAEPPPIQVRDALITAMRQSGATTRAMTPAARASPDYRITGRLITLRHDREGRESGVVVEAEITVADTRDRRTLYIGTYEERRSVAGESVGAASTAAGDALTGITARFLDDLARVRTAGESS